MKFTHKEKPDRGDVVAYINGDFLIIKVNDGEVKSVAISGKRVGIVRSRWNLENATHKFYKGDSVTITF